MSNASNAGSKHVPLAAKDRCGMGLCLSGGGFRAALFHLGALRRLNELGILSKVDTISSVSGGSIMSAHLAACMQPWPNDGEEFADWENKVAAPFCEFVTHDIRTGPVGKRLLPWNWFRSTTQVQSLAARYRNDLITLTLDDLPKRPRFIFCATDLVFGVNWVFEKKHVGDYQAGYLEPAPPWPAADAVAASSCFPPVFGPWIPPVKPAQLSGGKYASGPERDRLVASIRLSDGGVYDNLGTEPVWKDHRVVMVSDGGAPFRFKASKTPMRRLGRYLTVVSHQSSALRKRWLIANFESHVMDGTYWGIASGTERYPRKDANGYSKTLANELIARIRTDL
ncbi:MAG: patatin-like phospholipase family protein, partial [Candidatus Hydrogenedentota bacterium]